MTKVNGSRRKLAKLKPGRPIKFGAPVQQTSVHLLPGQIAAMRRYAQQRTQQEGVAVSVSDVVRIAVGEFIAVHGLEVTASKASN